MIASFRSNPPSVKQINNLSILCERYTTRIFLFILFASIILFSITPKTPNFAWMGVYLLPEFPGIFTGVPVFRIWIPIERACFFLFGNLWVAENLAYSIIAAILIYDLYLMAQKSNKTTLFLILLIPTFAIIFFASWGGVIYDIVFALSLIRILELLRIIEIKARLSRLAALGIWMVIMDLSRPIGIYFIFLIILYLIIKKIKFSYLTFCILAISLIFHIVQFNKFRTITLSTYAGQNLAEVFNGAMNISRDCLAEFGRRMIDTLEFSECSNKIQSEIVDALLAKPSLIIDKLILDRIVGILMPYPYWHGTGLENISSFLYNFSMIYYLFLVVVYLIVIINFRFIQSYLMGCIVFIIGFTLTFLAHSGAEAIRVFMPFLILLIWLPLHAKQKAAVM